jgi:hypothetical protein
MGLSLRPISDEIEEEFALLAREVRHLCMVLNGLDAKDGLEPHSQGEWEATTLCASAIEKIYAGCERVMARLAAEWDGMKIDKRDGWHRALLDRMRQPFAGRQAVLSEDTYALLDRMRAFRHRERNAYGFNLDTTIVIERAREVIRAFDALVSDVRRLLGTLPGDPHQPR